MTEPVKIAVVLEGGMLQAVLSAGVPVQFVMIDYDAEGADGGDVALIPQGASDPAPAIVHVSNADIDGPRVLELFSVAGGQVETAAAAHLRPNAVEG